MTRQEPMLMCSPITQRVFIVTSYKDEGNGVFTVRKKYDVTDQFDALAAMQQVNGKSRWFELFGTPELAARTLAGIKCCDGRDVKPTDPEVRRAERKAVER